MSARIDHWLALAVLIIGGSTGYAVARTIGVTRGEAATHRIRLMNRRVAATPLYACVTNGEPPDAIASDESQAASHVAAPTAPEEVGDEAQENEDTAEPVDDEAPKHGLRQLTEQIKASIAMLAEQLKTGAPLPEPDVQCNPGSAAADYSAVTREKTAEDAEFARTADQLCAAVVQGAQPPAESHAAPANALRMVNFFDVVGISDRKFSAPVKCKCDFWMS